ncbi:uncharacterized protein BDFB_003349 [Asbolus verrucosus]|uniref:Ricin B lectin domain-containing protein n=1 Tax=Asbolus verrucosus TaxID=1661398 RepID=A0A482VIC2_ASBVE|nr:uncharacterized protein BDFB_003349 [Asbolus verrucosus]
MTSYCRCHHHHHHDHDHHDHHDHNHHDQHKKTVIIKNPKSGLVLDGSEYIVKVQNFTKSPGQFWTLECVDHGRFVITNKANGKVLDIEGGAKNLASLITFNRHGGLNQLWYIHNNKTIISAGGNLAIDIFQAKYNPGNRVIAFNTHANENQLFQFQYDPGQFWTLECVDHGRFVITNKANGYGYRGGVKSLANLITFRRHGGLNQLWYINNNNTIVSAGGNLAIDIYHQRFVAGNHIVVYNTHAKEHQLFKFDYENGFQPQQDRGAIIRHVETGLVLDATEFEVKIQQYTGNPTQLWTLEPIGDGRFIIKNRGNSAVLDIEGGANSGAYLITYEQHGGENQQWYIKSDRTIVSAAGDLAVDIHEGNCYPGNFVIAYERHGGPNQQFNVEYQPFPPPPPYQAAAPPYQPGGPQPGFQPGHGVRPQPPTSQQRPAIIRNPGSGLVLDGSQYEVKLQRYTGSPAQLWIMEPLPGGKVIIRNKGNGDALDIQGGADCGANLITYEKHGGINQQWFLNPDNTIVSAAGNLAVDICEGNCYPGNNVIAYDKHGGANQQFHIQYQ